MNPIHITLAWPCAKLSPNARSHWSKKYKANKIAFNQVRSVLPVGFCLPNGDLQVEMDFYQPDKRARDLDNLMASMKPHLDAIFKIGGRDDRVIKSIVCRKLMPDGNARVELSFYLQTKLLNN